MGALLGIRLGKEFGADASQTAEVAPPDPSALITGASRLGWWKADTGVTSSSSRISAWSNIWGNGDLAQATGANQPLLATNIFGSLPAVYCDDAARGLLGTLTTPLASGTRGYFWAVVKLPAPLNAIVDIARLSNAGNTRFITLSITTSGGGNFGGKFNVTGSTTSFNNTAKQNGQHLMELGTTATAVSLQFIVSGVATTTGTTTAAPNANLDTIAVGSTTASAVFYLSEWVIMSGEPSTTLKTQMRTYFRSRYTVL
jgi:hypothetical protein